MIGTNFLCRSGAMTDIEFTNKQLTVPVPQNVYLYKNNIKRYFKKILNRD